MHRITPLMLALPLLCGAATTPSSLSLSPSAPDPVLRRDGAHHAPHHASHNQDSSYSAPITGFSNTGPSAPASHGPSYSASLPSLPSNSLSYAAPTKGYAAPQPSGYGAPAVHHTPPKQTGYYYYYYPIEQAKKEEKSFYGKMKKLFEPMWYPWDSMMNYMGYGDEQYNDYGYDTYEHYRSMSATFSDYVPWDSVEEVGSVLTQDQCLEFYMCELGSLGRNYSSVHFLVDMMVPFVRDNSYYRSLTASVLKDVNCFDHSCPVVRKEPIENQL